MCGRQGDAGARPAMHIPEQYASFTRLTNERHKLERLHKSLLGEPMCKEPNCFICSARSGLDVFQDRHTATSEYKWEISEKIRSRPAYFAAGAIAGREIATICDNFRPEELKNERVKNILIGSELPVLDGHDIAQDTQKYDQFLELYVAAFFKRVGCTNIKFEVKGVNKNVDLVFDAGKHRFAVECKRLKSKHALIRRPEKAKAQLEDYRAKDPDAHLLILLDCSYFIVNSLRDKLYSPYSIHETLTNIWHSLLYAYYCLQSRPPKWYSPVLHNVFYGTILTARVPIVDTEFFPNVLFQMLVIVDCDGRSGEAITHLRKKILRTMNKAPEKITSGVYTPPP